MTGKVFTGVREKWLPLYNELKEMTWATVGDFEEHPTTSAVVWRCGAGFAEVSARAAYITVGFAAEEAHPEWGADKTVQTSKHRVAHYFNVTDGSSFPVLVGRIAGAYGLARASRPQSRGPAEKTSYATVDDYIAAHTGQKRAVLEKTRETVRAAAPEAEERMSWQMPTWWQGENLVHFAMGKHHLGFYPGADGVAAFADKLTGYKTSKGAIQFPLDGKIPYGLIDEITRFRVKQAAKAGGD